MVQHRKFMDLALDAEGLHTPDGTFRLDAITKAEVIRHRSREHGESKSGPSPAGVIGGALLGGAIAGPLGLVGGGLLGSTVERESPSDSVPRTVWATLVFESPELAYSLTVAREQVQEAEAFVAAVKDTAGIG